MPDALQNLVALNCTFICLTETWHADGEHLPDMQGYVYHDLVRPSHLQSGKVPHGGIAVYISASGLTAVLFGNVLQMALTCGCMFACGVITLSTLPLPHATCPQATSTKICPLSRIYLQT